DDRECGDDGWCGSCGTCEEGSVCSEDGTCEASVDPSAMDADQDGFTAADDCNDADDTTYPGADEVADGIDNDCNGLVDDGICVPDCDGRECGPDGCGGLCGSCPDGICQPGGVCEEGCLDMMGHFVAPGEPCQAGCNIDVPNDFFFADGVCMDNGECWAECFVWW
ncbi:MAG: MopE-related protein, partial [Myxococcota bacterium]|nr:MopE-related protein [Myxococcota bacterium]